MARIIAIANQKGGMGKTTLAFHLAHALSCLGARVLALDNDPQANLTEIVVAGGATRLPSQANIRRLYARESCEPLRGSHFDLLGASASLVSVSERRIFQALEALQLGLADLADRYDYMLIDCLPSFGVLMLSAMGAARQVLVPARPSQFGLAGVESMFELIERTRRGVNTRLEPLGVLLTLIDPRRLVIERDFETALRQRYGKLVFNTRLHRRVGYEESATLRLPLFEYSRGAEAQEFTSLTDEFLTRIRQIIP